MAAPAKDAKTKDAKKPAKKALGRGMWTLYEQGKLKSKFCPKCGAGHHMASHKDRITCGKCGYTEFVRK